MNMPAEQHPDIVHITPSPAETARLDELASDIYPSVKDVPEAEALDHIEAAGQAARGDFPELSDSLDKLTSHAGPRILVYRGGAPKDEDIGPTPNKHLEPHENPLLKPDVKRGLITGMGGLYGYGYTSQQPGNIHNNVVAVPEHYGNVGISANPNDELGLHVEDASFNLGETRNLSPDFLTLHFLRNPGQVPSFVSLPDWSKLSPKTRELLHQSWFHNMTNPGQGGDANDIPDPVSVLYGETDNPRLRINTARLDLERYTPEQVKALSELLNLLMASTVDLQSAPGDITLIDNTRVLHGRRKYPEAHKPRQDGRDRWQRRLVTVKDPSRIRPYEVKPRIVDPTLLTKNNK